MISWWTVSQSNGCFLVKHLENENKKWVKQLVI